MKADGKVQTAVPLFVGLVFGILVLHPAAMLFECDSGGAWADRLGRAFLSSFDAGMVSMALLFALLGACLAALSLAARSRAAAAAPPSASQPLLQRLCMYCKAMPQQGPNGADRWLPMEHVLHDSQGMEFSHGVCPHCQVRFVEPQVAALKAAMSPIQHGEKAEENGP